MLTHHTKRAPMRRACVSRSRVHSRRRMMFRCAGYTRFGTARAGSEVTQPLQWSSEVHVPELALIYYKTPGGWTCAKHAPGGRGAVGRLRVKTADGRWTRRDPIGIEGGMNLYGFAQNAPCFAHDYLGNIPNPQCIEYHQLVISSSTKINYPEQIIKKMAAEFASKQIANRLLNHIIDELGKVVSARIKVYTDLVTHGMAYYYIVYAFKCKKLCSAEYAVGMENVYGNGGFEGRNVYLNETKNVLKDDINTIQIDIAQKLEST